MFKDPDQASDGGDERLKPQCLFSANMHHEANVTLMSDLDSLTNKVRMFMLFSLVSLTVFLLSLLGGKRKTPPRSPASERTFTENEDLFY